MKPNFISQIVNSKEMLSKIGTSTACYVNPISSPHSNRKGKINETVELLTTKPKKEISIFEDRPKVISKTINLTSQQRKIDNPKVLQSRNLINTTNILYFPKDHIFPNSKAYYSFSIKEHKPKIQKTDCSKSNRYYIDHDTLSSLHKQSTIDFSKMTVRNKAKPKLKVIAETIQTNSSSTGKTLTEESIDCSISSHKNKTMSKQQHLPKVKTRIPRSLEYNPNYNSIHPRSMTFVNYSSQATNIEKMATLREQGIPYVSMISNTKREPKGHYFNLMKGRIKEGIEPKYPSYMYCSDTKFGLGQTNDLSLRMNAFENGIYLNQREDFLKNQPNTIKCKDVRNSFDFMKKNKTIFTYLNKKEQFFSLKY